METTTKGAKRDTYFPIKHVQSYRWLFNGSTTLDEIAQKLKRERFQKAKPVDNDSILVVAAEGRPPEVGFIFIQRDDSGGELILLQTSLGRLPFIGLRKHLGIIEHMAGITILK